MKPIIELKDLTVHYRNKTALHGLDLTLAPSEILGIIGPNGSGKTTVLSCVEGLCHPTSGSVRVFSLDPVADRRRVYVRLGVQLQEVSYPPRIRVVELCQLFAAFYRHPANWQALLDALGLKPFLRRSVHTLSGGEKQKLSVVLALMGRPELLILDELSTGLDPETQQALRVFLRQIADKGTAMILVTHHLEELEGLADRILLLWDGRKRFLGTPADFLLWAQHETGASAPCPSLADAYLSVVRPVHSLPLEGLA